MWSSQDGSCSIVDSQSCEHTAAPGRAAAGSPIASIAYLLATAGAALHSRCLAHWRTFENVWSEWKRAAGAVFAIRRFKGGPEA